MSTEIKEQIRGELLKQKEEQKQKEIELNSKLDEIILYTKKNPVCENYKKFFIDNKIKFIEKDMDLHMNVSAAIQTPQVPVIEINDNYLVQGRDFTNPQQFVSAIRHYANPDYIQPSNEVLIRETLKNINHALKQSFQSLNRQLMPVVKVMNELAQEEAIEKQKKAPKKVANAPKKNN